MMPIFDAKKDTELIVDFKGAYSKQWKTLIFSSLFTLTVVIGLFITHATAIWLLY